MSEILLEFVKSGGLMAVLLLLFLIGFILEIMAGLCYDSAIENMHCVTLAKSGIVPDIIGGYSKNLKNGNKIGNTQVYVSNELHHWKKYGLRVERMKPAGDLFGEICVVLCVFFDMVMLIQKTFTEKDSVDIMRYVYVYTAISIIFFLVLKIWGNVADTANKRMILADGITNYIDNQIENIQDYVTLNALPQDTEEETDNSSEKNSKMPANGGEDAQADLKSGTGEKSLKKEDKELVISQVLDEFLV